MIIRGWGAGRSIASPVKYVYISSKSVRNSKGNLMRSTVLSAIVAASVFTLTACGAETASSLQKKALAAIEQNDDKLAIIHLKNAIKLAPKNGEIRRELSHIYYVQGAFLEADKEALKAIELGVTSAAVYSILIKSNYFMGNYSVVEGYADRLLEAAVTEQYTQIAILYKGLAKIELGTFSFSEDSEGLLGEYRKLLEGKLKLSKESRVERTTGNPLLQVDSNEYLLHSLLTAEYFTRQALYKESIGHYQRAIQAKPKYYYPHLKIIENQVASNSYDDAHVSIENLKSYITPNAYLFYLEAIVKFNNNKYQEAYSLVKKSIDQGFETPYSQLLLGVCAFLSDKSEESYNALVKAAASLPTSQLASQTLAVVQVDLGYIDEALENIENGEVFDAIDGAIIGNAALLAIESDNSAQSSRFNTIDTTNFRGEDKLKVAYSRLFSERRMGILALQKVVKEHPELDKAWILLAESHVYEGQYEVAFDIVERWATVNKTFKPKMLKALLNEKIGNSSEALLISASLAAEYPEILNVNKLFLSLLIKGRELEQAFDVSKKVAAKWPQDFANLVTLIDVGVSADKNVKQALLSLSTDASNNDTLALAESYYLLKIRDYSKAEVVLETIQNKQTPLYHHLAGIIYFNNGGYNLAVENLKKALEANDATLVRWIRLIVSLERNGNVDEAFSYVKRAITRFPDNSVLNLYLSYYLAKNNQFKQAENLYRTKVADDIQSSAFGLRLIGDIYYGLKRFPDAFTAYRQSLEKEYSRSLVIKAGIVAQDENDVLWIGSLMKSATNKDNIAAWKLDMHQIAEFYLAKNHLIKAKDIYLEVLAVFPSDFIAMNNIANILITTKAYDDAYLFAKQAFAINNDNPFTLDTLGSLEFRNGNLDSAEQLLEKAYGLEQSADIALHLAELYIARKEHNMAFYLLDKKYDDMTAGQERAFSELKAKIKDSQE